ncbi:MAG: AMP-binding protein [Methanobrevibacter sp.]|nr:AMP-binding protein [Methanobrevibacter sp.]
MNINTNESVETFLNNVQENLKKTKEYQPYFDDFRKLNDLILPDLQFYYKFKDKKYFKIPESNFTIIFDEKEDKLKILYNESLYSEDLVQLFRKSLSKILKYFIADNTTLLKDISLLNFDSTHQKYRNNDSYLLNEIFEDVVYKNGDNIALESNNFILTYKQLNCEANKIANALIKKGLKVEDRIIIDLEHDSKLIISILGILKSGGTFIIINPDDPVERINAITKDSGAKYIITDKTDKSFNINTILKEKNTNNPSINLNPNNISAIIYTSGSTGLPKGVLISHSNYAYRIAHDPLINKFLKEENKLLLMINYNVTNVFITSLFLFLFNGLKIVLNNAENSNLINLHDKTEFDVLIIVPSVLEEYLENKNILKVLEKMKIVIIAGEKFNTNLIQKFKEISSAELYNLYGITETGHANIKNLNDDNISVGKSIDGVLEMIADIDCNPLPPDIIGELYIGGLSVAKGYLNKSKLTKEKFIKRSNIIYFKSGDLAILNMNGEYSIIGRYDSQLKLRGQRIEAGEIENNIDSSFGLKKIFITISKMNKNQYLTLYFTPNKKLTNKQINDLKKRLDEHLKGKLPKWMLPQIYIYIPKFSLLLSGKINIRELPQPQFSDLILDEIIPPKSELEKEIFNYCAEILKYDKFGITNSFISMGFTSLSIMNFAKKVYDIYDVELNFIEMYTGSVTIEDVCRKIEEFSKTEYTRHSPKKYYPLTQQQLSYFFKIQNLPMTLNDNTPMCINFDANVFDIYKLKDALIRTIELNPYIKTHLINFNTKIYQKINNDYKVDIKIHETNLTNKMKKEFVRPFDLFKGPLFRFELYYHDNKIELLMDIHHIITDMHSNKIFVEELIRYYNNNNSKKKFSYFDYALDSIQEQKNEKLNEKADDYFKKQIMNFQFSSYINEKSIKRKHELRHKNIIIDNNVLTEFSKKNSFLMSDLFLAVIVLSLSKFLKTLNVLLLALFNGRDNVKYFNTIGLFFKFIYLLFNINHDMIVSEYLSNIQQTFKRGIEYSLFTEKFTRCFFEFSHIFRYNYRSEMTDNENKNGNKVIFEDLYHGVRSPMEKNETHIEIFNNGHSHTISIIYDNAYYHDEEIENLITLINNNLLLIINNPSKKLKKII